ncbi:MAG: endonuclease domain-containing protein [Proteobacteria bacterium]|nr:endonuclease domain-containing protein [Pseudomonadota bacterium]
MDRKWSTARRLREQMTDAERRLWTVLRGRALLGRKFRRQYPIAGHIVDFVCIDARMVIEVDGGQHADARSADAARTARIEALGYKVIRFWNHDVLQNIEGVYQVIERELCGRQPTPPQPSPASRGGSNK